MTLNKLVYKISRNLGGLQIARFLSRKHPKILMYHRISKDGSHGSISTKEFRDQINILKKNFVPMTLGDLFKEYQRNNMPNNAVVISFDDGYQDFSQYAMPILRELGVPATIFVTTGFVNNDIWLWPDQIRYALENSKRKSFDLSGFSDLIDLEKGVSHYWHIIADYCMTISDSEKHKFIDEIYNKTSVDKPSYAPRQYQALAWEQLRTIVAEGVEVGSHSHTHPILTRLSDEELESELTLSKSLIERELGISPTLFCYPNGQPTDYNNRIKHAVEKVGYDLGIVAYPKSSTFSDRFEVGRYPLSGSKEYFEKMVFGYTYLSKYF